MKIKTVIRVFAVFFLFIITFRSHIQTFAGAALVFNPAEIEFKLIADGLTQPIFITNASDGSGRLFIVERAGRILVFKNDSLLSTPFLDIRSIVNATGGEQGLVALAFHPSYDSNGQFYTVHTDTTSALVLSRFTRSSTDPDLANPGSRITLLTISHPTYQNHNGGTLAFGPDGYLYWSTGDGGGGGDPSNNAQNLSSLLGKILRLDVDLGSLYSIPVSNPFFNNPNPSIRKEIWAYGLRNPWRVSFDRQVGDMYIGDVGQQAREEINFQTSNDTGGKNYGWRVMEGNLCFNPSSGCDRSGKVLPIAEYDHSIGCSVTGGYVYRGTQYLPLQGYYFYGDFCTGVLFSLHNDPSTGWIITQIADTPYSISSFGEDENGELYLVDYGGRIYQIQYNLDMLAPGDVTGLTAATGVSNGSVNLSWIAPPDDADNDNSGPIASYLVRYSTSVISSETDWNNATVVSRGLPTPVAPGNTQTMAVSGLRPSTHYYFAIRAQDEQTNQSINFATASASTKVPTPVPPGTYDDADVAWAHVGTWDLYTGSGPYNNTLHQSSTPGNYGEVMFEGVKISLTYLKAPGRGSIDVYIDGTEVDTIVASSPSIAWQQTWTSHNLTNAVHTVRFQNAGGGWIDLDGIQVFGPVNAGIHDDVHAIWTYSGTWGVYSGAGPYGNTLHQSNTTGSYGEVVFNGTQVKLTYLKAPGRGSIAVYIDDELVDTIVASSSSIAWQQTWTSEVLSNEVHTVRFQNAGGGWIDLDAIRINAPVLPDTYDNGNAAWSYSETWMTYSGSGPYGNTLHQSNTTGSYGEVVFDGMQVKLTYLKAPGRGSIAVYIDGTEVDTIVASSSSIAWQQTWTSEVLSNEVHTVRFQNAGGGWIDLDAIQVIGPMSPGIYDDAHAAWSYSETWMTYSGSGPYGNTLHQSNTTGSYGEVVFDGMQVKLTYLKAPGRGSIAVYIDDELVDTIVASSSSIAWQQIWTSEVLSNEVHTVRFQNAGGGWIDLDAIQIIGPVSLGTYDDVHATWSYSGTWTIYRGSGPYANTLHQSGTTGSYGEVTFQGMQVTLAYLKAPGRGSIAVYIDDELVDTIVASSSSIAWQQTWTSEVLSNEVHTVRFQNAGGGWIDLDAVQIQ